jgi:site-specific recombinase XerD
MLMRGIPFVYSSSSIGSGAMMDDKLKIRDGLWLVKVPRSRSWYARCYMNINGQYVHYRSTRTTNIKEATRKAEDFRADCVLYARGDSSMPRTLVDRIDPAKRFDRVVDDWLDELEKDAGKDTRKLRNFRDKKQLCFAQNGIVTFFGKADISKIDKARIGEYLRFKVEKSKKGELSSRTQKNTLVGLSQIFKYAAGKGLIAFIPAMPKVRVQRVARTWLNEKEYERLLIKARALSYDAMEANDRAEVRKWREMLDFVQFMVGSFLRASEWASLRHRHIEVVKDRDNPHLRIAVIKGKTKPRYTISMPWLVNTYDRIVSRNYSITHADLDPDGYVFLPECPNRYTASKHMRARFGQLLDATGLKVDALGQNRVTHCLRHSAIMFRLLEGVDSLLLARNAGTSVEQIELHYASQFTAEMKLGELHKTKAVF